MATAVTHFAPPALTFTFAEPVTNSLSPRKIQEIKDLPKFNAHCHLGGEIPIEIIKKHGDKEQKRELKEGLAIVAKCKDYKKAFFIFPLIARVINTHEILKKATIMTCERLKADNNKLVLMRTGLKPIEGKSLRDYLDTVLEGIREASSPDFLVLLMLSLKRSSTAETAKETVDLALEYRSRGVLGIDISDISTDGDIRNIMPQLEIAKEGNLKIAVHMGELPNETDQMLIIKKLSPDFIDHGVLLCPDAASWIRENKIPVTVCLTSSLTLEMHPVNKAHPWIEQQDIGEHPIDLGTDDATVFGNITLSNELIRLTNDWGYERVVAIAKKSFERAKQLFGSYP
ncbi:MAG: hypothetical protein WC222_10745 [Parachlamydiales bacterium]|jgi:adenosine deaminase